MRRTERIRRWLGALRWLLVNLPQVVEVLRTIRKDVGSLHIDMRHTNERFYALRNDVYGRVNVHQALGHPKVGV